MKKEKQVCWRDLTWIWRHLCACPLIDHGQQPMKMRTEVTLLYNVDYCTYINNCSENKPAIIIESVEIILRRETVPPLPNMHTAI